VTDVLDPQSAASEAEIDSWQIRRMALGLTTYQLAQLAGLAELAESIHISLGLTILILVVVRIGVRLTHRPPPLSADMPAWERILSSVVHLAFYALMLVIPLTGWAIVSLGSHPISFWGLPWPHLPGVHAVMGNPTPKASLKHLHVYILIWLFVVNWSLHVAGALKHQFDGRPVLWRMTWLKPRS
jgi:cytochrome b561